MASSTPPSGEPLSQQPRPVAIVTGAGSAGDGIGNGRAAAILLARRGFAVVVADLQEELAQRTVEMIEAEGGEAIACSGDVSAEADARTIVESAAALSGPLKALVNNVGIADPEGNAVDIDLAGWQRTFEVNVTSMLLMARFAIPEMIATGSGSIVNVSSIAGTLNHPRIAYATTKGAVLSLTKSLAAEYGPHGIRANTVAPGLVYTPLVGEGVGIDDEARRRRAEASPLRTEGTGWDVGRAVVHLATDDSSWITGVTLPVDAGFSVDLRLNLGY